MISRLFPLKEVGGGQYKFPSLMEYSTFFGPEVKNRPGDTPQSLLSVPAGQLML
jgi:hypothetical protein